MKRARRAAQAQSQSLTMTTLTAEQMKQTHAGWGPIGGWIGGALGHVATGGFGSIPNDIDEEYGYMDDDWW